MHCWENKIQSWGGLQDGDKGFRLVIRVVIRVVFNMWDQYPPPPVNFIYSIFNLMADYYPFYKMKYSLGYFILS